MTGYSDPNYKPAEVVKDVSHRPICPECGEHRIVLFTPPKAYLYPGDGSVDPDAYKLMGTNEYIDWDRAELYCGNGSTNCRFRTLLSDLGKTNVKSPTEQTGGDQ